MQVHITVDITEQQLASFRELSESITRLFSQLKWGEHVSIENVHARIAQNQSAVDAHFVNYERDVCDTFIDLLESGNSPRESLSLTVSEMADNYPQSSYDNVKKILTKNKLIKNTGFYSTKHKY